MRRRTQTKIRKTNSAYPRNSAISNLLGPDPLLSFAGATTHHCACCPVAGSADVSGKRLARKPAALKLRVGEPTQLIVKSRSGPVVRAGVHPRRDVSAN